MHKIGILTEMLTIDDIEYASNNSRIVHPPSMRLSSRGAATYNFRHVCENMDDPGETIVREGLLVCTPREMELEEIYELFPGFSEAAWKFGDSFNVRGTSWKNVFTREKMQTHRCRERFVDVLEKVLRIVQLRDHPADTVLVGVDVGWDIGLVQLSSMLVVEADE